MTLLLILIALAIGVVIGATERGAIINEMRRLNAELPRRPRFIR